MARTETERTAPLVGDDPFLGAVARTIAKARSEDEPVCVACLGVTGEAAEERLEAIGAALAKSIRGGDVVARLDGDHFALLLHNCELDILEIVARRLLGQVTSPLTGAMGVAYFSDAPAGDERAAAEVALSTAREALAAAVAKGPSQMVVRAS